MTRIDRSVAMVACWSRTRSATLYTPHNSAGPRLPQKQSGACRLVANYSTFSHLKVGKTGVHLAPFLRSKSSN